VIAWRLIPSHVATPVIVQQILIQKLVISQVQGLDPINVFIEDLGPGSGTLTLTCHDRSWTTGWNAMGDTHTVARFIGRCDNDYLVNCLSRGLSATRFSGDALAKHARLSILARRRAAISRDQTSLPKGLAIWDGDGQALTCEEAREQYVAAEALESCQSLAECPATLMAELFGEEWWFAADNATEPNPSYRYLVRIVEALREAVKSLAPAEKLAA
jgi:hypothetical protein